MREPQDALPGGVSARPGAAVETSDQHAIELLSFVCARDGALGYLAIDAYSGQIAAARSARPDQRLVVRQPLDLRDARRHPVAHRCE